MNFKIIFTIIGIVFAVASTVYSQEICTQQLVCGSDGITYSNPCALNDAAESNPDLVKAHDGACAEQI